ncbi:MAG: inorganic phosphate transporter [Candidatus Krumholzibacteria bacterium]
MLLILLITAAAIFVAYTNGANDNFKGVATLLGSGTTSYRRALSWATVTTLAGSIVSVFWAQALVRSFSGKGLVPDVVAASPEFVLAVAGGAGVTILLATMTGFPISTTHSLTGALVGGGLVAVGSGVRFGVLGKSFVAPLLFSPIAAVLLAAAVYGIFRYFRTRLGVTKEWVVLFGRPQKAVAVADSGTTLALDRMPEAGVSVNIGPAGNNPPAGAVERYAGSVIGIGVQRLLDGAHFVSAGMVSFARGLNDTPKIVALLLVVQGLGVQQGMLIVAVAMAAGGLLSSAKVAHTVSHRITPMNHGQGFTANLVTAGLVIFSSRMGLPVSTTHVSVGSLFGIGMATRQARGRVVSEILLSWVLTLPVAGLLSAGIYWILKNHVPFD